MLQSVTGYLKKRQKGFAVLASFAGGAWLLTSYARQRFQDLSERMVLDSNARENMRRRFRQNQEDCTFVLLAQLPTLSRQLFAELDVEALTAELQRRAEVAKREKQAQTPLESSTASLDASLYAPQPEVEGSVENLHPAAGMQPTIEAAQVPLPQDHVPDTTPQELNEQNEEPKDTRSKGELWQAIKIQTFHRTITALYLICLLDLLTHIQLNLLGRYNYVSSIYEQAHPENVAQINGVNGHSVDEKDDAKEFSEPAVTPGKKLDSISERQYLSFGWWFLQKGWKQVSSLVAQVVEESLGSVSLKAQYGMQDFNKLLVEIRRKIDYESTGAVHSFATALFPSKSEDEHESLSQSGLPHSIASAGINTQLREILNETQDFLDSPDFSIVLRSCLDKSFELLSSSLSHLFLDMPAVASGRFEEVSEKKVRLAAILPALARASHSVLEDMPNEYADALANNRELQEFSAVVFSHFTLE